MFIENDDIDMFIEYLIELKSICIGVINNKIPLDIDRCKDMKDIVLYNNEMHEKGFDIDFLIVIYDDTTRTLTGLFNDWIEEGRGKPAW